MNVNTLWTGNGVSFSPIYYDGMTDSGFVRITAANGMAITDGNTVTICVDRPCSEADRWEDCEKDEEATEEDYKSALNQLGVSTE